MRYSRVPSLAPVLEQKIQELTAILPALLSSDDLLAILLIGSCSEGRATYRSDIDLLFILKSTNLNFSLVRTLRNKVDSALENSSSNLLPLQCNFVLKSALQTQEPALSLAIKNSIVLWDPEGIVKKSMDKKL